MDVQCVSYTNAEQSRVRSRLYTIDIEYQGQIP